MLVFDDEAALEQSLRSVLDLIDYWVICDTGSSDRTQKVVSDVLGSIPGELHSRDWVDYGHNRSELMELAEGKADYLLLLDPDMSLARSGPLPELVEDAYVIREAYNPAVGAPRVVSGSRLWWYEGSVHEVLATNGRWNEGELGMLGIERRADDATRKRKLLRELGVLQQEMASEPASRRTVFLIAQTLHSLGRTGQAIEWYRRRVEFGDADEETFYANLQEGSLRVGVHFPSAVPVLLEAWQRRPTRAEPLYELARSYRDRGDAWLTHHFADIGLQIPEPPDRLGVRHWIYEWGLQLERGWAAGRLGRLDEAAADLHAVLRADEVPDIYVDVAEKWLDELEEAADPDANADIDGDSMGDRLARGPSDGRQPVPLGALAPGLQLGRIQLDVKFGWPTFNPSIAANGDRFSMIVRSENVAYDRGKLLFPEETHRNVNYLVDLDAELAVTAVELIDEHPPGFEYHDAHVTGFMDLRLVHLNGRWVASGSCWQLRPGRDHSELALLDLDGATVTRVSPLDVLDPDRREKNWMPFVHDGELHYIYRCGPMLVYRYNGNGTFSAVAESESPEFTSAFRGGSQGLPLDDGGYLFIVHETYRGIGLRSYLHRFIRIDSDLRLDAISRPFTFTDETREFCAGAAIRGSDLVMSFGVRHTEAWLGLLPLDQALALLEPVSRS